MKHFLRASLLTVGLSLVALTSQAQTQTFYALLSGPNESPANASPGLGLAFVNINPTTHTMRVQVDFSGLTAGTSASHIHAATASPFTGTAGVATTTPTFTGFPGGVTSGTYDNTFDMTLTSSYNPAYITANGGTTASAEAALFSAIGGGKSYLNIHTTAFPTGEIRGFLAAVPEPGTNALIVSGVGVFGTMFALRRRRKANKS